MYFIYVKSFPWRMDAWPLDGRASAHVPTRTAQGLAEEAGTRRFQEWGTHKNNNSLHAERA